MRAGLVSLSRVETLSSSSIILGVELPPGISALGVQGLIGVELLDN